MADRGMAQPGGGIRLAMDAEATELAWQGRVEAEVKLRPNIFAGEEKDWSEWAFVFKAYIFAVGCASPDELRAIELRSEPIILDQASAALRSLSKALYFYLVMLVRGNALSIIKRVEPDNGAEAWRLLCQRYQQDDEVNSVGMLQSILEFDFGDSIAGLIDSINNYELLISNYNKLNDLDHCQNQ